MHTPQIIYIALSLTALLYNAYLHGKPKEGKNNFWSALLATVIVWSLLIWGGFLTL